MILVLCSTLVFSPDDTAWVSTENRQSLGLDGFRPTPQIFAVFYFALEEAAQHVFLHLSC